MSACISWVSVLFFGIACNTLLLRFAPGSDSTPPPNQLMVRRKRTMGDQDDNREGMSRKKRSVTPACPTSATEALVGFDSAFASELAHK